MGQSTAVKLENRLDSQIGQSQIIRCCSYKPFKHFGSIRIRTRISHPIQHFTVFLKAV